MSELQNEPNPQDELKRLLKDAQVKGGKIADLGRQVTEAGQYLSDLAGAIQPAVEYISLADVERSRDQWSLVNQQADRTLSNLAVGYALSLNSTAGTASFTTVAALNPEFVFSRLPEAERERAETIIINLQEVVQKGASENDVIMLMKDFGLDKPAKGKKSPIDLFTTAHKAYKTPVNSDNPVSTSLIPMRESIWLTITELLTRRITQEPAKKAGAKIISIGNQLKRAEIQLGTVKAWAEQWEKLIDLLSDAKEKNISRDEWRLRLQQATLFLKNFLGGLDAEKVNRR